ncbi:shikimate dehydrogenase [Massilia sp. DWR3-1-1]|uniref:shikimate dehydrogenase n=1 Tax=Massilia sp. DWR3-1-1 TaxID=2804559 RepID=UPI003CE93EDD
MHDFYRVIGNPVGHSKSPAIHAAFARQLGIELEYATCLAPLDGFAGTVAALAAAGCKGANVTVPFKIAAFDLCTRLTARAQAAGAVNTLSFDGAAIAGDNTDGAGLVADIVGNAGVTIAGKRVLLVGAGGAARGAILPLLEQGPAALTLVNRTAASAHAVAAQFDFPIAVRQFEALDGPFDIVINATSASLTGALPPLPAAVFGAGTLALDMMYGAAPTPFMAFATGHGASARDGLGMLVEQAAEAFHVWRGVRPATAAVLAQLRAGA